MPPPPRGPPGGRSPRPGPAHLSLARALSKFGVCSRTEAAHWIQEGRVRVSGRVVTWPELRIDPRRERVTVDGERGGGDTERIVIAFHKPPRLLTTRTDPGGPATRSPPLGDVGRRGLPGGRPG